MRPDRVRDKGGGPLGRRKNARPPMLSLPRSSSVTIKAPSRPGRIEEESSYGAIWSVAARRGRRRTNREDMFATLPFVEDGSSCQPVSIFGIFDGHGGPRAAQYACKRLPDVFLEHFKRTKNVTEALEQAFLLTDKEIMCDFSKTIGDQEPSPLNLQRTSSGSTLGSLSIQRNLSRGGSGKFSRRISRPYAETTENSILRRKSSGLRSKPSSPHAPLAFMDAALPAGMLRRSKSRADEQLSCVAVKSTHGCGTTATVLTLVGDKLSIAHVGDSRAVLSRQGGKVKRLFEDHRPGRPDEQARIESSGGLVINVSGTLRVNGVLAVSRAIGDVELKELVIASPEISCFELRGEEEFFVVASDGLWDVVSDEESVRMVREILLTRSGDDDRGEEEAAKMLVQCAWDRGSSDDTSVIVVNLMKYMNLFRRIDGTEEQHVALDQVVEDVNLEKLSLLTPGAARWQVEVISPLSNPTPVARNRKQQPW